MTAAEHAVIAAGVVSILNSYRTKAAWGCVSAPDTEPFVADEDDLPALPTRGATKRVRIDVLADTDASGGANVRVGVQIVGQRGEKGRVGFVGSLTLEARGRGPAVLEEADFLLTGSQGVVGLLDQVSPCAVKSKIRGKTTLSGQGVNWTASFEGETKLELIEDGSFSGSIPISYAWGPIVVQGGGVCTISAANQDAYEVVGEFNDGDGTLKFSRMESHGLSGTLTSTCTIAGVSSTVSLPAPSGLGGDAAAGSEIRIALEDGAQTSIPIPPQPGVMSEMTLELSYGDDGGAPNLAASPDATS